MRLGKKKKNKERQRNRETQRQRETDRDRESETKSITLWIIIFTAKRKGEVYLEKKRRQMRLGG